MRDALYFAQLVLPESCDGGPTIKCCFAVTLTLLLAASCLASSAPSEYPKVIEPPSQVQGDLKVSLQSIARERQFGAILEDRDGQPSAEPTSSVWLSMEDTQHRKLADHYTVSDAVLRTAEGSLSQDFETSALPTPSAAQRYLWSALPPNVVAGMSSMAGLAHEVQPILEANLKEGRAITEQQAALLGEWMASLGANLRAASPPARDMEYVRPWHQSLVVHSAPCAPPGTVFDLSVKVNPSETPIALPFSGVKPGAPSMRKTEAGFAVTVEKVRRFDLTDGAVFAVWATTEGGGSDREWQCARVSGGAAPPSISSNVSVFWVQQPGGGLALVAADPQADSVDFQFTMTRPPTEKQLVFEFKDLVVP